MLSPTPPLCGVCVRGAAFSTVWRLLDLHHQSGLSLVAIDPIACLMPFRAVNDAAEMMASLLSLRRLTAADLSALFLHHPR